MRKLVRHGQRVQAGRRPKQIVGYLADGTHGKLQSGDRCHARTGDVRKSWGWCISTVDNVLVKVVKRDIEETL